MKKTHLTIPEVGAIAATRGILGMGIGLLIADRMDPGKRRLLGWTLFLTGLASTVPLAIDVFSKIHPDESGEPV